MYVTAHDGIGFAKLMRRSRHHLRACLIATITLTWWASNHLIGAAMASKACVLAIAANIMLLGLAAHGF